VFTGIVEQLGTVVAVTRAGDSARLSVCCPPIAADVADGDSVAVNGVCLTVVESDGQTFVADVMAETLRRSSLGEAAAGDQVNLERAVTLATRMGGHLVQGHVDGVATVAERRPCEHWETVRFLLPAELTRYIVEKGSIAVDGVSLTVVEVDGTSFSVGLIPTTLKATTLGAAGVGTRVNIEVDVMAKYVEKLLRAGVVE
jgi:riboflavin synthase